MAKAFNAIVQHVPMFQSRKILTISYLGSWSENFAFNFFTCVYKNFHFDVPKINTLFSYFFKYFQKVSFDNSSNSSGSSSLRVY